MSNPVDLITAVTSAAFVALGVAAGIDWLHEPDRRRGMLAAALVSLGLVAGTGFVQRLGSFSGVPAAVLTVVAVVLFMAFAYFVLLFRDSFIPLQRSTIRLAGAVAALATAVILAAQWTPVRDSRPLTTFLGLIFVITWAVLVGEPIIRFWTASRDAPRVQRQRMRGLSVAFAVLIADVLVSVAVNFVHSPLFQFVIQLAALAMVPVIWVSVKPPAWLRRQWRANEEEELRRAVRDLLIFSPGRVALAEKAVGWAVRIVGGGGGVVIDGDGVTLARVGVDEATVGAIRSLPDASDEASTLTLPDGRVAIVVQLPLDGGTGLLAVLGGPFTPVFGTDEMVWLSAYGSSVTAGLERARVTERLAAMERTKTQFLNLASHELRGPLTVIRGYLSMFDSGGLGTFNEDGRRALEIMQAKATEMNGLVEQMLEAARLEEGRLELHIAPHDLRSVVEASVDQVRPLVDDGHPITIDVPPIPITVAVDAERIQTIVTNLVDNAVKYSPGGGGVRVEVVTVNGRGPAVRVHDQGIGIDSADMPRLFTRFGRIATAANRHLPGTGLGLYLSRELARLHGGDITVESRPGQGSTFTLQLPGSVA